jgi:hypothetical protein
MKQRTIPNPDDMIKITKEKIAKRNFGGAQNVLQQQMAMSGQFYNAVATYYDLFSNNNLAVLVMLQLFLFMSIIGMTVQFNLFVYSYGSLLFIVLNCLLQIMLVYSIVNRSSYRINMAIADGNLPFSCNYQVLMLIMQLLFGVFTKLASHGVLASMISKTLFSIILVVLLILTSTNTTLFNMRLAGFVSPGVLSRLSDRRFIFVFWLIHLIGVVVGQDFYTARRISDAYLKTQPYVKYIPVEIMAMIIAYVIKNCGGEEVTKLPGAFYSSVFYKDVQVLGEICYDTVLRPIAEHAYF